MGVLEVDLSFVFVCVAVTRHSCHDGGMRDVTHGARASDEYNA